MLLAVLKDDDGIDNPAKKKEIEGLLMNPNSDNMFAQLSSIGNRITDFRHDLNQVAAAATRSEKQHHYEYRANEMISLIEYRQKHVLYDDDRDHDSSHKQAPPTTVDPHDIDACWLHSKVCQAYGVSADDRGGQELVEDILKILADEGADDRGAENRLAALLEYDKLHLIRLLLRNRLKIVWCTRLARAQDELQRDKIEQHMATDPRLAPMLIHLYMQQPEECISFSCRKNRTTNRPS